ncbi:hypothetical protein GCM10027093_04160 [Paraburkholderia jirisanensis]
MKINNGDFAKILEVLDRMKPLAPEAMLTAFDRLVARIASRLLWSGGALFIVLASFAGWVRFVGPLRGWWLTAAICTGIACMVLALLSIIVETLPSAVIALRFRKSAYRRMLLEVEHDLRHAQQLCVFDKRLIERTDTFLALKIERLKGQLGFFLGGADKVAMIALAGMGWAAFKEFQSVVEGLHHDIFIYGLAFSGGIAFGGVLLNIVARRYSYQRDLLTLALDILP